MKCNLNRFLVDRVAFEFFRNSCTYTNILTEFNPMRPSACSEWSHIIVASLKGQEEDNSGGNGSDRNSNAGTSILLGHLLNPLVRL